MMPSEKPHERLIRKPELREMIGLSDTTVWRLEKSGGFPKRIQIGGSSVAWLLTEVLSWIERKAAARNGE
jgi:prophage regulatory protein